MMNNSFQSVGAAIKLEVPGSATQEKNERAIPSPKGYLTKAGFCGRSNIFCHSIFYQGGQNLRKYGLLIQFNLLVKLRENFVAAAWNNNNNSSLTLL